MKKEIEHSSGNLYADLGHKNAEEMQAKGILARTIYRIIKQKKLSQLKAAKLLGIPQPSLCKLLQGNLAGFSTDRLLHILKQLGQDIDIKIKPIRSSPRTKRVIGRTSIFTSDTPRASSPIVAKGRD